MNCYTLVLEEQRLRNNYLISSYDAIDTKLGNLLMASAAFPTLAGLVLSGVGQLLAGRPLPYWVALTIGVPFLLLIGATLYGLRPRTVQYLIPNNKTDLEREFFGKTDSCATACMIGQYIAYFRELERVIAKKSGALAVATLLLALNILALAFVFGYLLLSAPPPNGGPSPHVQNGG